MENNEVPMDTQVEETETLKLLSAEDILAADDIETRTIPVKEWGGAVMLRTMDGNVRDEYTELVQSRMVGEGKDRKVGSYKGLTVSLLHRCLVKPDGSRLFTREQLIGLQKKSSAVTGRLVKIAQEMNGLTDDEVEKIAGNSEGDQSDESGSTSPDEWDALSRKLNDD